MISYLSPCEVVEMAMEELEIHPTTIQEVVSLYIDPTYQRQGVGSLHFSKIISVYSG
jgi:GNAT superfamily N-acetyltransferase